MAEGATGIKKPKGKRLVYVPEELISDVLTVARMRGETIGRFVEEAVRLAIRACTVGLTPEKAAETLEVLQAQRILGGVFVPQEALDFMLENVYRSGREELLAKWFEGGRLHGRYLKERFGDPVEALKCFLEATRWDLNEVDVFKEGEAVRLRCVSTALSVEATELLCKFLEGVVAGLACEIVGVECLKGMVVITFKP
ncbi:MAG: hypothetical protein QW175_04935 [Candidatus Bathyarchaeia archaeon]